MVNERVNIKDKNKRIKKVIKFSIFFLIIFLILIVVFVAGYLLKQPKKVEIILQNPLAGLVLKHTNEAGLVNKDAVVEEGIIEFGEEYITYILVALGTKHLHKSILGEAPILELVLDEEVWTAEVVKGMPYPSLGAGEDEDLRITMSKKEAVEALLSEDVGQFMKDSVYIGNIQIEMIAGKTNLFAKGYLDMYKELTGEEIVIE